MRRSNRVTAPLLAATALSFAVAPASTEMLKTSSTSLTARFNDPTNTGTQREGFGSSFSLGEFFFVVAILGIGIAFSSGS